MGDKCQSLPTASDERLLSSFPEPELLKPRDRLTSSKGNIYTDRTACLDDPPPPPPLAVAIGKMREVINQVVSMFDVEERGEGKSMC